MIFCILLSVCAPDEELGIIDYIDKITSWEQHFKENQIRSPTIEDYKVGAIGICKYNWFHERITCLHVKYRLVIIKTTNYRSKTEYSIMAKLNHKNVAKRFLSIRALRDGIEEFYFINAHYEGEEFVIDPALPLAKYDYLLQIARGIEFLHTNDIIVNNLQYCKVRSTVYDNTINEMQLDFVNKSYDELSEKKEMDARKPEKDRKKGFIILDVIKNDELLVNPIGSICEDNEQERNFVLADFGKVYKRDEKNKMDIDDVKKKYCGQSFMHERNSGANLTKAIDSYSFGIHINKILKKPRIDEYKCGWEKLPDDDAANKCRNALKSSKNLLDKIIYDCTEPQQNKRPDIYTIINRIEEAKSEEACAEMVKEES